MELVKSALSWVDLTMEQLIISLLIIVICVIYRRLEAITHKYNQLDKLIFAHSLIISNRLNVKTVKIHRTGDYEIHQPIDCQDS
jgi:hypothetical protein